MYSNRRIYEGVLILARQLTLEQIQTIIIMFITAGAPFFLGFIVLSYDHVLQQIAYDIGMLHATGKAFFPDKVFPIIDY